MDPEVSLPGTHQNEDLADPFRINRDQYLAHRNGKTYGTANPSIMDKPFWKYMIARGGDGHSARQLFHDEEDLYKDTEAVWCFSRLGRTVTKLPDGRHVLIGGEHEDYYDPDFCIYNDVVVISAPQPSNSLTSSTHESDFPDDCTDVSKKFPKPTSPESIAIYGYPVDVFPPTDFHTSTYFRDSLRGKEFIFIIGGNHNGSAVRDRTDVYQLDLSDFTIQLLETSGANPGGGTVQHEARLVVYEDCIDAAIKITTKFGQAFSLLIKRLEWVSHGS